MTFEALNDNIILVELSREEMKKHHITYESLNGDKEITQNAVKSILHTIKAEKKYNTRDKIIVEALPVNDGGCFFIFTFVPPKKTRYKVKKPSTTVYFYTESIDNLLDFLSVLKKCHSHNSKYTLYKMNDAFYMEIPTSSQKLHAIMGEYGSVSREKGERLAELGENLGCVII